MKHLFSLISLQALLAVVSSVLFSKMSFLGRLGLNMMYKEYGFLKVWWKTALILFAIQLALIIVLSFLNRLMKKPIAVLFNFLFLLLGIAGAYYTYLDFTGTASKYMKTSFHSGGYLFWVAWTISCIFFIVISLQRKKSVSEDIENAAKTTKKGEM